MFGPLRSTWLWNSDHSDHSLVALSNVPNEPRRASSCSPSEGTRRDARAARRASAPFGCYAACTHLRQWVETVQWLVPAGLLPQHPKLGLMQRCPFGYESHGPCWQLARDDTQAVNGDPGFRVCVLSVEMRRRVIREVHLDDDPVEPAYLRHRLELT